MALADYDVIRELGRGGMAAVHLARQREMQRLVALKELGGFQARDPASVERFLRESRLAGSLNHPNIVTVYEYFEDAGTPYIAMELVEGGSLRPLIGELSLPRVARVLEDVLAAVGHAGKARHRAPRHQAREHPHHEGRAREGRRLRDREGRRRERPAGPDVRGDDRRHAGVHVARAGARQGRHAGRPTSTRSAA